MNDLIGTAHPSKPDKQHSRPATASESHGPSLGMRTAQVDDNVGSEPTFTLFANDASAPNLVEMWAAWCEMEVEHGARPTVDSLKAIQARECAATMRVWRLASKQDNGCP